MYATETKWVFRTTVIFFKKNHFAKANATACYNVYAAEFLIVILEMPLSYSK